MLVHWRSDLDQGKHNPLEVVSVITKTGSTISAALVVPLDPVAPPVRLEQGNGELLAENAGLHEVIETQMAEIDRLVDENTAFEAATKKAEEQRDDALGANDHIVDCVQNLCVALGYARNPMQRTGIAELDELLEAVR